MRLRSGGCFLHCRSFQQYMELLIICRIWKFSKMAGTVSGHSIHCFIRVAAYAAYLWRLEHLGHNWNLIMASPVRPIDLFLAKFVVVAKLALLTHLFVFLLYAFCGKVFAHFPGFPPMILLAFLLRGALGALAVIAAQLVLAMVIRSFAIPIFLGLVGGITGLLAGSKGLSLFWSYTLMQAGMNANKSNDVLSGGGYKEI